MTPVCIKIFGKECKITAINPRGAKTYFVSNEHLTKHDIDRVTSRTAYKVVKIFLKLHFKVYYSKCKKSYMMNYFMYLGNYSFLNFKNL